MLFKLKSWLRMNILPLMREEKMPGSCIDRQIPDTDIIRSADDPECRGMKMGDWISFTDKLPEVNQKILVYKTVERGAYYEGIYLAWYAKPHTGGTYIVIDDLETNKNNYRGVNEFSHWMPLPTKPI